MKWCHKYKAFCYYFDKYECCPDEHYPKEMNVDCKNKELSRYKETGQPQKGEGKELGK